MTDVLDFRPVLLVTGILLAALGVSMLAPALVGAANNDREWSVFVVTAIITTLIGTSLFAATRGTARGLSIRQAMLMTAFSWLVLVFFASLPFVWTGAVSSYTDAFFEAMSGLTTTGATVIVGLDTTSASVLFWRGLLQWIGGLGVIVMAIAVLPMLQIGGMQLFKAEAFDTAEKILPRARQISSSITFVFIGVTALCALLYVAAGMGLNDAAIHAMTTVATGGFSTKDSSIAHFDSAAIEWIAVAFMIAGAIPFLLYVQLLRGQAGPLFADAQVRAFLWFVFAASLVAWFMADRSGYHHGQDALRHATFNVVSVVTGTGYTSTDYGLWGSSAVAFFFVIMFAGGCAGSTSCGIKIFRFLVLFEAVREHIYRVMYPHGVFRPKFNGRPIDPQVITSVMSFFFLFMVSFATLSLALVLTGLDTTTALSGAGSALSNVGPGLGDIIGPAGNYSSLNDAAKWILAAGMFLGRLELFTILVLFMPRFWRA